jgi:flavin-dependent dehydrogenase
MVVACMTDADLWEGQGGWLERLRAAPLTSELCGELAALPRLQIVSAASVLRQPLTGTDWLAVGDAAMAFDPLSGQGMFKALDSGLRSARAIERMLEGDSRGLTEYAIQASEAFEGYRRVRTQFYANVRRWPESEFWQRRAGAGMV